MTRVRFDPTFLDDLVWEELGSQAFTQHFAACSFVVRNMTDGFVSDARLKTLTPLVKNPVGVAAKLVTAAIWRAVPGGYMVCDCVDDLRSSAGRGDEQPSRAFVTRERARQQRNKEAWKERREQSEKKRDRKRVPNRGQSSGVRNSPVQAVPEPAPGRRCSEGKLVAPDGTCCPVHDAASPSPRSVRAVAP